MEELKKLAEELGLVETFHVKSSRAGSHAQTKPEQPFDYLIIIDFESTCWDSASTRNQNWQRLPEIIEFPAILFNINTGEVEEEFHHYVMPVENPKLSDFCMKLTGITQEQVDAGIPLGTCLGLFSRWITKISQSERKLSFHKRIPLHSACTFVTWSDWDLGICLHNEAQRKQLKKPGILSQWIDLRALYKAFYNRHPHGLRGALAELGIPFTGREHSGIVDARNTASLAFRMVKDGCQLKLTRSEQAPSVQITSSRNTAFSTSNSSTRKPLKTLNELGLRRSAGVVKQTTSEPYPSPILSSSLRQSRKKAVDVNTPISRFKRSESRKRCDDTAPVVVNVRHTHVMKTPEITEHRVLPSSTKRTPPLCQCGRRAVCKVVNSPGPNQGRSFFTCTRNKRSLGITKRFGCNFFMWCGKDM